MRTLTASEASRYFSDLLDAIERGESITVTRGGRAVAELRPPVRRTGARLRAALTETTPPADRFADDIAAALDLAIPLREAPCYSGWSIGQPE